MPVPAVVAVDDDQVLIGNAWSTSWTLPATDSDDDPLSYGTFTVSCKQVDGLQVSKQTVDGLTVVTISATADQVVACGFQWFHWYLAEDVVFGDIFLTGRVQIVGQQ